LQPSTFLGKIFLSLADRGIMKYLSEKNAVPVDSGSLVSDMVLIAHYGGEVAAIILSLAILTMAVTRLVQVLVAMKRYRL
jgi:hypothetical protein